MVPAETIVADHSTYGAAATAASAKPPRTASLGRVPGAATSPATAWAASGIAAASATDGCTDQAPAIPAPSSAACASMRGRRAASCSPSRTRPGITATPSANGSTGPRPSARYGKVHAAPATTAAPTAASRDPPHSRPARTATPSANTTPVTADTALSACGSPPPTPSSREARAW